MTPEIGKCNAVATFAALLVLILACGRILGLPPQKSKKQPDRPKLPYGMLSPSREDLAIYDSKAQPVATITGSLTTVNRTGWEMITKYFPALGTESPETEKRIHPEDPTDSRFFAHVANEAPALSPMPLLCMIWSLADADMSGPLKKLHDEVAPAMGVDDYSTWKLNDLRNAVNNWTEPARTPKGVKFRRAKPGLSFKQALQLYAMTLALVRMETRPAGKGEPPPPDLVDFTNRLKHQLPVRIPNGETRALLLYYPSILGEPIAKGEFEERADVVVMKRKGAAFEVEQFPVYLTADLKVWNPSWIEPRDEITDSTLMTRKWEWDWTRLDGPFLWSRPDQYNGEVVYRATVKFQESDIVIEAERFIERRGAVKKVARLPDYDPSKMTPFTPDVDTAATQ